MRHNVLSFSTERALHNAIEEILSQSGFRAVHEYSLDRKNRIDFFIPEYGIGIEAKVNGSIADIERQLARYAEFERVREIVVVTTRLFKYPDTLCGKPIISCKLLRAIC